VLDREATILVAEDNAGIGLVLRLLLEGEQFRVILVTSLNDAVDVLERRKVDLVLTDSFSQTPETALENLAPLLSAAGKTPVALMTAHDMPVAEARARGLCALIHKPFELDRVLDSVRNCLDGSPVPT
jgi:DNA-binding NtrC family response regulator